MVFHDGRHQTRIRSHVAERYGILDMSLVCQILAIGALQEAAGGDAKTIPMDLVGHANLLHGGE